MPPTTDDTDTPTDHSTPPTSQSDSGSGSGSRWRGPTRRRLLQAAGAASVAGVAATTPAAAGDNQLVIKHVCRGDVEYTVCVTGEIGTGDDADPSDDLVNGGTCATGTMGPKRGRDTFHYSGTVKSVHVEGPAIVEANGNRLHTPDCLKQKDKDTDNGHKKPLDDDDCDDDCGSDDFCPLANRARFIANVEEPGTLRFELAVTGVIELADGERVSECTGEVDPDKTYEKRFRYSGEIECVRVRGPGKVVLDQDKPCN